MALQSCQNWVAHNCYSYNGQSGSPMWDSSVDVRAVLTGEVSSLLPPLPMPPAIRERAIARQHISRRARGRIDVHSHLQVACLPQHSEILYLSLHFACTLAVLPDLIVPGGGGGGHPHISGSLLWMGGGLLRSSGSLPCQWTCLNSVWPQRSK